MQEFKITNQQVQTLANCFNSLISEPIKIGMEVLRNLKSSVSEESKIEADKEDTKK